MLELHFALRLLQGLALRRGISLFIVHGSNKGLIPSCSLQVQVSLRIAMQNICGKFH